MTSQSTSMETPSPYRWAILSAFFLAACLSGTGHFIYPVIGTFVSDDLGLSATQLGILGAASFLGQMSFNLFSGFLVDRVGVRNAAFLCAALMVVALCLSSVSSQFLVLAALAFGLGIGLSFINPMTQKGMVRWFTARELGLAVGVKQSGIPAASAINAALLPAICVAYGWRSSFIVAAAVSAAFLVIAIVLYRDPANGGGRRAGAVPRLSDALQPARDPEILRVGFVGFAYGALTVAQLNFFVLMLREWGLSPVAAGSYLAVSQIISIVIRPLIGFGSDRFTLMSRTAMLGWFACFGGLFSLVWLAIIAGVKIPGLLVAVTVILGIVNSWTGLYYTVAAEIGDASRVGTNVGFASLVNSLGTGSGPIVFGWLADATGSFTSGIAVTSAVCCASGIFILTGGAPHSSRGRA